MSGRKLLLRKESLTELTPGELRVVAAGTSEPHCFTAELVTCTYATLTFCPDFYCSGTC